MKVEIVVSRKRYPKVGQVLELPKREAQALIDSGIAKEHAVKKKK